MFRFDVSCVVFIVSGCRKEKNERHFAWLLIAFFVCCNLIQYVCVCFCLVFVWHLSFFFSQYGGAITNPGDLTFEGSATFTSCSAVASSSSADSSSYSSSSYYYYYYSSYYYYDSSYSEVHAVSGGG